VAEPVEVFVVSEAEVFVLDAGPTVEIFDLTESIEIFEVAEQGPPGPRGESATDLVVDPLAYYILAKA
jgi:hypothetical protein